jgi:hypothetical protein
MLVAAQADPRLVKEKDAEVIQRHRSQTWNTGGLSFIAPGCSSGRVPGLARK